MKNLKVLNKNYTPGSMNAAMGFMGPPSNIGFSMNADFEKAKEIINHLLSEGREIIEVEMGLDGDWRENSMTIWLNGEFSEYDRYGSSVWAEPIIVVKYNDGSNDSYAVWYQEIEVTAETIKQQKFIE